MYPQDEFDKIDIISVGKNLPHFPNIVIFKADKNPFWTRG